MYKFLTCDDIEDLEIELTLKCQLKCWYCENVYKLRSNIEIDFNNLCALLKNFKKLKSVSLCGFGEPTLCSSLLNIINFIHSLNNVKINLFTNGTAQDLQFYQNLASKLNIDDTIIFSIYGSTNELNKYYRINQNLNQLIKCINIFQSCKVTVNYIQMEYNRYDFQRCINDKHILIKMFNHSNINIQYIKDCWTLFEQFNYKKAKELKICTEPKLCIKNILAYNKLTTDESFAKKVFYCESFDNKSLFVDVNLRIFPCPDMRIAADSQIIQKMIYKKYLNTRKKLSGHILKMTKQFIDMQYFNYDDIYELNSYKEICNQVGMHSERILNEI